MIGLDLVEILQAEVRRAVAPGGLLHNHSLGGTQGAGAVGDTSHHLARPHLCSPPPHLGHPPSVLQRPLGLLCPAFGRKPSVFPGLGSRLQGAKAVRPLQASGAQC